MASAEDRFARLEDCEAIRNLIASYGPLADRGAAPGVAGLWTIGGEYDVGGFGTAQGRAAIARLIESETHRDLVARGCAHVLSPHHIELAGARARATGYSIVFRRSGETFVAWRVSFNEWHLERQADGRWLVAKTHKPASW